MRIFSLGDVCLVTTGQPAPQEADAFGATGTPFVRAGSLERLCDGESEDSLELVPPEQAIKFRLKTFPKDTIVFPKSGMSAKVGRVYRLRRDWHVVSHLAAVLPSRQVDSRYLHRWFEYSPPSRLIDNDAYPSIKTSTLEKIEIPLPPLPEQRRIAAILDKVDAMRVKRRESIAKLDKLLHAVFLDMFGDPETNSKSWPRVNLSEAVNSGTIVTYGIVQAGPEDSQGVPYIRTGDIVEGEIEAAGLKRTNPEIAAKFLRSRVRTGDIVMSIRATVGTTALVPAELDGANLTQGTARIAAGERMDKAFLLFHLRSASTQRWISQQVKGATFREITLGRLRELPVMNPPRALQDEFGVIAARAWKTILNTRESARQMDRLFCSLQQRVFSGLL